VVAEGRRVIANIERASNLFLVKNVYSLVLALITAVTLAAYPLAPIQLTLISAGTIGIPRLFLPPRPNPRPPPPGLPPPGPAVRHTPRHRHRRGRLSRVPGHPVLRGRRHRGRGAHHRHPGRADRVTVDAAHPGPPAGRLEARAGRQHGRCRRPDRRRPGARA